VEAFATEATFLAWVQKQAGRVPATLILLDSSGPQLSSIAFSQWLGKQRDQGAQHLIFAIGPHDGWSATALALTQGQNLLLSFGPITLPHELARLVLAEQLYRACTILQGHPYHSGH
jgi:23S rRNA (pseudouridine1915-N3)-methyltransferase